MIIVNISLNKYSHFLLINNKVYACGMNDAGQLGVGDKQDRDRLTEINLAHLNLAPGDKVKQVVVGRFHTICLTERGRSFVCGKNDCGQLGVGDERDRDRLTEINLTHLNLVPGE